MADSSIFDNPHSNDNRDGRQRRFMNLEHSIFPNNQGDYMPSFMKPDRATDDLYRQSPAADPLQSGDPEHEWRHVGKNIWHGEVFMLDPRADADAQAPGVSQGSGDSQEPRNSPLTLGIGGYGGSEDYGGNTPACSIVPGSSQHSGAYPDIFAPPAANNSGAGYSAPQGPPPGPPPVQPLPAFGAGPVAAPQSPPAGTASVASLPKVMKQLKFTGWNNEGKIILWHCQRVAKKSFLHWLERKPSVFPGETEASLKVAWTQYSQEAEVRYEEWKAAGGK